MFCSYRRVHGYLHGCQSVDDPAELCRVECLQAGEHPEVRPLAVGECVRGAHRRVHPRVPELVQVHGVAEVEPTPRQQHPAGERCGG